MATVTDPAPAIRPEPATNVLSGSMPYPLQSSRARGWSGLTLELHSFRKLDVLVEPHDHVIAVHLSGGAIIHRTRDGRTRTRTSNSGDVTITSAGSPVHWRQAAQNVIVLLRLSPEYVRTAAQEECEVDLDRFEVQDYRSTRDPRIEELARRLLAGLELEGVDSQLYVDSLIRGLAMHLLRAHMSMTIGPVWMAKAKLSPYRLHQAMSYIDENLRNELTLVAIADAVALSPGHFAHAFRDAIGVAPHRYVLQRRVERAKELLRHSNLPISVIASQVGCSSHNQFSVLFHRMTGVTPREYRRLD